MARKTKARKGKGKKVYAIIVDGETEFWYFTLLKRHEREGLPKIDIRPELPKKKKLKEQYEKVVEYLEFDVYDKVFWQRYIKYLISFSQKIRQRNLTDECQRFICIQNSKFFIQN